jgi:glycosyltransferase involved in cell wall biosynthesis
MMKTRMTSETNPKSKPTSPKITIVLSGLGPGGTERVVSILSNEWVKLDYQVTVMCFESSEDSSYYPLDLRVKVIRLGLPPVPSARFVSLYSVMLRVIALRRALEKAAPDVIISFLTRNNVLALLSTVGMKIPVVVSERNNPKLQRLGIVWRVLRNWTYRRAFGLVTMTQGAMNHFPASMRVKRWVIPNPVILSHDREKQMHGAKPNIQTLTGVGRLVKQKGFDLLIAAFAAVAISIPTWQLVIWGEGPERHALKKLVKDLAMEERILLPGVSEHPSGWIKASDAFVLSSRFEGWGNVLLEAMASGLPVVSFDCEWGPAEMIADGVNGILVAREDVTGLSRAITTLMKDDELRRRLGAAAALSARKYSPDKILVQWNAVVSSAVET